MGDSIDDAADIIVLILWLIMGVVSISFCASMVMKNLQPYTMSDKSTVDVVTGDSPTKYQWTVRDYLLMCMVTDDYCPDPKLVDIILPGWGLDTKLVLDSEYVVNKAGRLQKYYVDNLTGHLNRNIEKMDYYYENDGENGRWRFYAN